MQIFLLLILQSGNTDKVQSSRHVPSLSVCALMRGTCPPEHLSQAGHFEYFHGGRPLLSALARNMASANASLAQHIGQI